MQRPFSKLHVADNHVIVALSTTARTQQFDNMSPNSDNKQAPIFSSKTEALLAVKLFELRNAKSPARMENAVEAVFRLVHESMIDESFKDLAVSMKAIETVLDATNRPFATTTFLHRACCVCIVLIHESSLRTSYFIDIGGLDRTFEIVRTFQSNCFVMTSCVALYAALLGSVTAAQRGLFAARIIEAIITILELHDDDSSLYGIACHALGRCPGPGVFIHFGVFQRVVQSIVNGIVVFMYDENAQSIGRRLLMATVGPETAASVIDHAEMHHNQAVTCSCAA